LSISASFSLSRQREQHVGLPVGHVPRDPPFGRASAVVVVYRGEEIVAVEVRVGVEMGGFHTVIQLSAPAFVGAHLRKAFGVFFGGRKV
jgi:hypothetical protein